MVAILTGTVDTTGGGGTTALGRDAPKLFDQVQFSDEQEVIKASGAMLRGLRQIELGAKAVDTADVASAVNASYEFRLEIMLKPLDTRHCRPGDFRIPLEHFLEGGVLNWNSAAAVPTGFGPVNADWRVRWEFFVEDGRQRELKSRRRIYEQVVQNQEFDYACNGSIRSAIIGSKLTTTGYTSLSAFSTIFSRTLETPPSFSVNGLRESYRKGSDVIGSNDEFLLATPAMIPLVFPHRAQRIGKMINAKTLHIDLLAAAPASGRLLLDLVTDRTPLLAAATMGYQSPGELAAAMRRHGQVQGEQFQYPVEGFNMDLVKRLPVRLKSGNH